MILLIESLNPLLADGGSQARPLTGNFEEADEDQTEADWNKATQDAIVLMDKTCALMKRWGAPAKFADEAAKSDKSDALLSPFTQYIKHLTRRYKTSGRPSVALDFEGFATCIEEIPEGHAVRSQTIYGQFSTAWGEYRAILSSARVPKAATTDTVDPWGGSTRTGKPPRAISMLICIDGD